MTTSTMRHHTMASLTTALLLTTTSTATTASSEVPPSRIITNEDLYNIMLTQSQHLHSTDPSHRHLHTLTTEQKSSTVRNNWLPISSDTEFLPNLLLSDSARRRLGGYDSSNPYSAEPFVDGLEYYDEDAQSWRKLGFIIDCQANDEDMYSEHSQHSGDQDQSMITETGCARYLIWAAYVNENYEGNGAAEYSYYDPYYSKWDETTCSYANGSPCTKMDCHLSSTSFSLLGFFKHKIIDDWMEQLFKHQGICTWSDEDYAFMKNARKAWPQGCTMTNTKTKGGNSLYYDLKPSYSGQITIGMYTDEECVKEYYMSTTDIEKVIGNIFANAGSQHSQDNNNNNNNNDGSGYDFSSESLSESLNRWNSAFDIWDICHSCVSHDISNTDGSTYFGECYDDQYYAYKNYYSNDDKASYYNAYNQYYNGNNNNNNGAYCSASGGGGGDDAYSYGDDGNNAYNDDDGYNGGRKLFSSQRTLGGEYCPKGCQFECYDDAGYTSVNQCMKFSAKTVMRTASFRDLSMANLQGTLTAHSLSGYVDQTFEFHSKTKTNAFTYTFLVTMSMLCIGSLYYLVKIIVEANRSMSAPALSETLV